MSDQPDAPIEATPAAPVDATPAAPEKTHAEKRAETWAAYKSDFRWATPLLFVLILAIPAFLWGPWQHVPQGEESMNNITSLMFATNETSIQSAGQASHFETGLVVPFEILSVLLLAALIAGVVIAIRDDDTQGGR